ncbi:MAG: phosphoadenylyl-sulfate reductase [Balneolaceae bacterium]
MSQIKPTKNGSSKPESVRGQLAELNRQFEGTHPDRVLAWASGTFGAKAVIGTGFGPSGIFLIHRAHILGLVTPVFYLDTQLLFEETYALRDKLEQKLGISIHKVSPDLSVREQAEKHGEELWNRDPNHCCYIRKVAPLKKYLSDKEAWITGIRRNQSVTREDTQIVEYDAVSDVIKINPLAAWDNDRIWDYIRKHDLPYNPLHDEGFPSIGCIPCTSPVAEGEDERNGRWRGEEKIECGIHFSDVTGRFERDA